MYRVYAVVMSQYTAYFKWQRQTVTQTVLLETKPCDILSRKTSEMLDLFRPLQRVSVPAISVDRPLQWRTQGAGVRERSPRPELFEGRHFSCKQKILDFLKIIA